MTEYEVFILAPRDRRGRIAWINANSRHHWAVKAQMTKDWRTLANAAARAYNLPQGLQKAHVTVYVHKTNSRAYDVHNLYGTAKAAIDGLIDYELLPDDNNDHMTGPDMRHGTKRDQAGITIVIQDLSDAGQT